MASQYLLLWLEAPLQSWGFDSKFGRRDTLKFPTRSGVLGLLCAALGYSGEQKEFLAQMSSKQQLVVSYLRNDEKKQTITPEPLLMDFQMVGSGYDDSDPWQSLLIPKTSEGKKAVGGGSKMTYRYYLQDARFAVVLECSQAESTLFSEALQNPMYDLFLGRKNCVPTEFIYQGVFDSENAALEQATEIANQKGCKEYFRVVEGDHLDGDSMTLNDIPLQFGEVKKYRDRRVSIVYSLPTVTA
jgi:CRISPR system Cascade subunit CasD